MAYRPILYRSVEIGTEGRTLLGVALTWNKPATVRDFGGPEYLEEFARSSADVTLRRHKDAPFPLFKSHGHVRGQDPLGVAAFEATAERLLFRANVSRTRDGDEALELVRDGALTDVSVGFRSIRDRRRPTPEGVVTTRVEIALRELSLAPTGFGQVPEGKVLAMRGRDARLEGDALRRRCEEICRQYGIH